MFSRLPRFLWSALVALLLVGCEKPQEPEGEPPIRPVKTVLVESSAEGGIRQFPARIDSLNKADLSFRVPGKVKEILVAEGEHVEEGQLLARLDDTDYLIVLNDRRAVWQRAKNDFERAKKLIKDGYISRTDYDKLEAAFTSAEAALKAAEQDLAYTELKAPFAGTVAKRYVEQFEEVQPNEPVLALSDTSSLKVIFDVPEKIILTIKQSSERDSVKVWASFDAVPNKKFELRYLEAATQADPQTQTFQITFTMPRPKGLTVLPGMTATVTVDMTNVQEAVQGSLLPLTAVTANAALEPIVWVVDDNYTVHAHKVELGQMQGSRIQITGGIENGVPVVAAGTAYLAEGMKVRLLPEVEQAEPRPDDLRLILLTRCPPAEPAACADTRDGGEQAK